MSSSTLAVQHVADGDDVGVVRPQRLLQQRPASRLVTLQQGTSHKSYGKLPSTMFCRTSFYLYRYLIRFGPCA